MIRTLRQFAAAGHGRLHGEDRGFHEIAIDSRKLAAGDLFAALRGDNADGHDFVPAAAAAGCRCRRSWYPTWKWHSPMRRARRAHNSKDR